ncbi:ACP S-malonyltransferase [Thermoactinomyces sp. CICC 10522]|uniref:ACP S-malonyltransferase n=1 Tax=Thermoactinomyces sp. CICC 10522 TaxID=2767427 RepID=UPI0018DC36C3|nr:ACP S-malonyltransferase [Thermoactinomyces sp. CICC 10522]MBH8605513.1 ACP S-malonyltransferase [Thermoactinomyces sp. CICC 10522]
MTVYVFPGQGAQSKGMGGTLFDEFPALTKVADEILGYSIKELCLEDSEGKLGFTEFTQPALFTVNALHYLKKMKETGGKPDYVAGHSLGEYNALFAAGVFDFETGLTLVKKRGELMGRCTGGGMAAVIGLKEAEIAEVLSGNGLDRLDIANLNSPTQIVISGPTEELKRAQAIFGQMEKVRMFVPLKTSGAFHSRYMKEIKAEFASFLNGFTLFAPAIPVISNVSARPYGADIKQKLIEQIDHPVRWTESIQYLMGAGETDFEEVGPGNVLKGLIRRIQREAEPLKVEEKEQTVAGELLPVPAKSAAAADEPASFRITASSLGSASFKRDYNLKYAYLTGGMYRGIASKELVVRVGKAGMMGFFGSGGLQLNEIEEAILAIQRELNKGEAYGFNLVHQLADPAKEEAIVQLFLRHNVPVIEASAFLSITPALVLYRAKGVTRAVDGSVKCQNKIIAKVSRPEVAEAFLSPAPERIVDKLLSEGKITRQEADMLKQVPMADDLTVEADSGGHTDGGAAYALLPAILKLRDRLVAKYGYAKEIRVGAAGGIGSPEAAAAAFTMGADYILTGSINQCTVEAKTSHAVKDLLEKMNVQDTEYAPAGDLFELGAKIQVLKKGVFFPARANKLFDLYRHHDSWDEIDAQVRKQIEEKYFKRTFEEVYEIVKGHYSPGELQKAEMNPKQKMAMIFKWYFHYSNQLALNGSEESRVDYQIHCGPALGSFNQWVKGTPLENWRNRHVDEIGIRLLDETARVLTERFGRLFSASAVQEALI